MKILTWKEPSHYKDTPLTLGDSKYYQEAVWINGAEAMKHCGTHLQYFVGVVCSLNVPANG